jgi:hypothetical protein
MATVKTTTTTATTIFFSSSSVSCVLQGGLGNQLFQIFTTIAYALDNKIPFYFSNKYDLQAGESTSRHTYWNTFLSELSPFIKSLDNRTDLSALNTSLLESFSQSGYKERKVLYIREKEFAYNALPKPYGSNTTDKFLYGYFQSAKYFDHHRETLLQMIQLSDIKAKVLDKYPQYKYLLNSDSNSNSNSNSKTISMHFRLGDYKRLQGYHPVLPKEYYLNALLYVKKSLSNLKTNNINYSGSDLDLKILYFCEENDEDLAEVAKTIHYLQSHLNKNIVFEKIDGSLKDWEQMIIMSLCSSNIIANSTFSWWGAYFNTNHNYNNIVCYPKTWFGIKAKHNIKDLFLDNWIQISNI